MAQFLAFFGAISFQKLAAAIGAKRAVVVSLAIWAAAMVYIYLAVDNAPQFLGVEPVSLRPTHSKRERSRVFEHLRGQR
jgi:MFS-type transporter involved in bile tolerance (Atg22 family)